MSTFRLVGEANVTRVDPDGEGWLSMPAGFYSTDLVAHHDRFDWVTLPGGALMLRACPHLVPEHGPIAYGHPGDPDWNDGCICGLVAYRCAACPAVTITASEDAFPEGWLELTRMDKSFAHTHSAVFCSLACVAAFSAGKPAAALPPARRIGFAGGE